MLTLALWTLALPRIHYPLTPLVASCCASLLVHVTLASLIYTLHSSPDLQSALGSHLGPKTFWLPLPPLCECHPLASPSPLFFFCASRPDLPTHLAPAPAPWRLLPHLVRYHFASATSAVHRAQMLKNDGFCHFPFGPPHFPHSFSAHSPRLRRSLCTAELGVGLLSR